MCTFSLVHSAVNYRFRQIAVKDYFFYKISLKFHEQMTRDAVYRLLTHTSQTDISIPFCCHGHVAKMRYTCIKTLIKTTGQFEDICTVCSHLHSHYHKQAPSPIRK